MDAAHTDAHLILPSGTSSMVGSPVGSGLHSPSSSTHSEANRHVFDLAHSLPSHPNNKLPPLENAPHHFVSDPNAVNTDQPSLPSTESSAPSSYSASSAASPHSHNSAPSTPASSAAAGGGNAANGSAPGVGPRKKSSLATKQSLAEKRRNGKHKRAISFADDHNKPLVEVLEIERRSGRAAPDSCCVVS